MTKLEEFRDWLYAHQKVVSYQGCQGGTCYVYVDEIINYFEDKFSEELYFAQKNVINQRDN